MMILFMILKLYFGLIISFGNFSIISGGGKGGRAASKVGLVGIGQVCYRWFVNPLDPRVLTWR